MKNKFLLTSFLFFIIHTNLIFCSAAPEPLPPVLDVAGKLLRAGVNYYILPAIIIGNDIGGGLTLANGTCPPEVIQDNYEFTDGIPLVFSPLDPKKGIVRVSSDTNVKFSSTSKCAQSSVWKLSELDALMGKHFVGIGGVEGNPGPKTLGSWFKIETFDRSCKLKFCPSVCKFCKVICKDIGIVFQKGKRRLALSDDPFKVIFKRE
ncbi:kunitz trypsin inhibitor 2-like [Coffea eugenioides]|uniref:kunitz trypsin inhibitor 2-like n=1 Tax=Coffea eugenioides TaxID=49369 RepID=UPI000F60BE44|nr:kunitz trypsin inhibitor 2-like [Coffea eugenioides]